ncbi:hypothetical protein Rhe02_61810 [Rhizocola hellebori]|uniref:GmrSD restriction endonucleases N-terminal domain-containing protein n=1 Tax=Rhizocola hellebori TaxID=1392758 RepID=A0A8J3QC91_9ACTN|nr:DUF262 domain-containing protein [Rhizocola hellebori]GIH08114.1 hypothetical protein Rhe02_61810 [Rhizocola hellebori]
MPELAAQLPHRPRPGTYDIPSIVEGALAGRFRIPKFQRNYQWDTDDVLSLFDSIWRGFPVGTLLFWVNGAPAERISFGPLEFEVKERTDALWVVDGQQRITSLVGALNPSIRGVDDRFEVFFDLRAQRFVQAKRGKTQASWLPLYEAIETRRMLAWLREHGADLTPDDFDVADAVAGALREYQAPTYTVATEDDYLLRQIFDRVNSAGKPIGRTQIFHALFASDTDPTSPSTVVEGLSRLGFGRLDENKIVQTLLAIRGGNIQRDLHGEFEASEVVAEWYEKTEVVLQKTIEFLREEGIPHLLVMPSTLPIPVLGAFFYLHPDPDPYVRRLLAKWLWRGTVHGFGSQGQTPALRQAVAAVNPFKLQSHRAPDEYSAVVNLLRQVSDDSPSLDLGPFTTRDAPGKLAMLALASLRPLDLSGQPINLAEVIEDRGVAALRRLVPGPNNVLGNRGFWPGRSKPTGAEDEAILLSHGIGANMAKLLREGLNAEFIRFRDAGLVALVNSYVIGRIDPKSVIRRPIGSLIVSDEDAQ